MRGWFPRRCAVEAVDHYDSCQVLLPPMVAKIISDPFQVGKRKESCKEANQVSQKKSRETKKKKWGRKKCTPCCPMTRLPCPSSSLSWASSWSHIAYCYRPIVFSGGIVNNCDEKLIGIKSRKYLIKLYNLWSSVQVYVKCIEQPLVFIQTKLSCSAWCNESNCVASGEISTSNCHQS